MNAAQALAAARAAAAQRGAGDALPGAKIEPTDRITLERLMEFAVIEVDPDLMRSTRRLGAPITWAKRTLLHVLRQYTRELESQQTRFNLMLVERQAELEDRLARLEERAERAAGGGRAGEDVAGDRGAGEDAA